MKPLTVNELIAELQVVSQRGYGDKPVSVQLFTSGITANYVGDVTSIWDMNDARVNLTLEMPTCTHPRCIAPAPNFITSDETGHGIVYGSKFTPKPVCQAHFLEIVTPVLDHEVDLPDAMTQQFLAIPMSTPVNKRAEPAPAPDDAKICIQFVDQSLRDKLIPTTKKMASMMRRPQVKVTNATIEDAMNVIFDNAEITLPNADMITVETVAQTLAKLAGYRLNDHGRWDCGQSPTRYCEEEDTVALEAGFRVGDPINNNPRCDACCLCNALVPRNDVLTCRGCGNEVRSI